MKAWVGWRPDPMRLALGLWLAVAAAVAARTVVSPVRHSVFPIFAASASHWWTDQPLYQPYADLDTFRYPPFFAVAVTPLAILGLRLGGLLWSGVSLAVLLGGLISLARDVAPGRWTAPRTAAFVALSAAGALRGLWNAQSNALVVGLMLLSASALARALAAREERGARWWRAAVLLALPVCLKLTPVAPALLLCALWPRRLAWRFALAVAVGFLIPFLTRPPDVVLGQYAQWLEHLAHSGNDRWMGFRDGWTAWLAARHLVGGLHGQLEVCAPVFDPCYRPLQLLAAVATLVWCLWQRRRAARLDLGGGWLVHVSLSAGMAWLMLFGPAVEHATYVFLAPMLAWAVVQHEEWPAGRLLIGAAAVLILVLGWGAVSRQASVAWPAGGPLLVAALPVGTSLFLLWLAGYSASRRLQPPHDWPAFGGQDRGPARTWSDFARKEPAEQTSPTTDARSTMSAGGQLWR
jgi:hypothetical protein